MTGLTTAYARQLLKKHGPNTLQVKNPHPWYKMLFEQFQDVLVLILLAAAVISFALGEVVDAGVIAFIVLLNATIGFIQEFRTEKTLEKLRDFIHPEIRVVRDGKDMLLPVEELVPGDIVMLAEGNKVPADGILREAHSFRVDEAVLTGESVPIEKKEEAEVFMGTLVAHGSGVFEVTQTGMQTRFGHIAQMTASTVQIPSPLQKELAFIGVFVMKVTAVLCLILFGIGIFRDLNFLDSLLFSVSVAIAAVPEGLPTTITVALALGATILARKRAVVRKLSSVETLGSVTTICSDKTGTLTRNQMAAREVIFPTDTICHVTGIGYDPHTGEVCKPLQGKQNAALSQQLMKICLFCNEAELTHEHGHWDILGDPTEGALLTLARKAGFEAPRPDFSDSGNQLFPFDSDRKMMSVVTGGQILVKGSPDQLLEQCTHWFDGEKTHALNEKKKKELLAHYQRMAENALRVLAFGFRDVGKSMPETAEDAERDLIFTGFVGMIDPPREEVRYAVKKCKTAGIRIIVITGDYGLTAHAIAQELGIADKKTKIFTGEEVHEMSDDDLENILKDKKQSVIFARSMPEQKMRIVKLLQKLGEVVAMTGDGVNDAPALKKADIGIAMGITGTDVSKEAATMVLTDDSFASIVTAIEEGRRIYENLKKFVWFIFSCNIGELFLIFAAIIFQFPLPLTAVLILCVDLGTDILPAIALGVDNAEEGLMRRAPRSPTKKVLDGPFVRSFLILGTAIGISVTGAFLWTLFADGWTFGDGLSVEVFHAQTVAFASLVFVQLVNAFSARSETVSVFRKNPFENTFLILAIITSIFMVMLMIYVPFLNMALKTTALNLTDWFVVAIASVLPLAVIEIRKAVG